MASAATGNANPNTAATGSTQSGVGPKESWATPAHDPAKASDQKPAWARTRPDSGRSPALATTYRATPTPMVATHRVENPAVKWAAPSSRPSDAKPGRFPTR